MNGHQVVYPLSTLWSSWSIVGRGLPCEFYRVGIVLFFLCSVMQMKQIYSYTKILYHAHLVSISVTNVSYLLCFIYIASHINMHYCIIPYRNDITVTFQDENQKELGRDYFVSPQNQCTVSGYGNIKTITPRGGSRVFINASADLCGRHSGDVVEVSASATSGQVTDCF